MAIGISIGNDEYEDDGPIGISSSFKEDCRNQGEIMQTSNIPEDRKATILKDLIGKREALTAQLEILKKKVKTDDEYLTDFPVVPRLENIRKIDTCLDNPSLEVLKDFLNKIEDLEPYSLESDYEGDIYVRLYGYRTESDNEYSIRVQKMKELHVRIKRQLHEHNLGKNIKGLEKNIAGLTRNIERLDPPPSPEERFKQLVKDLDPHTQSEILHVSKLMLI